MQRSILAAFTVCGLLLSPIQHVAAAQAGTSQPLVGSWEFTATPTSSPSTPIEGLATFTSDETVIEADTSQAASHVTPGHGIWQASPAFGHWFIRFTNLVANPNGTLHSRRIFTMTVEVNSKGDKFTGGYSFDVEDPSGHVITTGSGAVTGELMVHPLLP